MPQKKKTTKKESKKVHAGKSRVLGKGVDIGTAFIACAEKENSSVVYRSQRDAFFDVEYNNFTKRILANAKVNYVQKEDTLYVIGDEALEFANLFGREVRRPLSMGILSPREKDAFPIIEIILRAVVGQAREKGEIVYYSTPADPVDADFNVVFHENILREMLEKLGYKAKPIKEGLAVVFSELAETDFTGMGFSFGAGMVNICFAYKSIPVFAFSLTKSGDWIDEQTSKTLGQTASRVIGVKEKKLDLTKRQGLSKIEQALSIYYDNLLEYALAHTIKELESAKNVPQIDRPIPIVLSGGTALPKGFLDRFKKAFSQVTFPFKIGEIRLAKDPLQSVAKGALVAALSDEDNI